MDSKAQLTVDIVAKVVEGKIDIVNAAKLLNKSRRTIERYLKKYQKVGIQFVVHQNTGKLPSNKTCDEIKRSVQSLIKKKYFDVNLTHLGELLGEDENIQVKRESLRGWAHEIHHVKRARRRRSRVRKRRERMESPGLLLQMDGSTHRWFGNEKSCLIAIIDDATSEVHAEFFESETTQDVDALVEQRRGLKNPHPNRVAPETEKQILALSLEFPTHGAQRQRARPARSQCQPLRGARRVAASRPRNPLQMEMYR